MKKWFPTLALIFALTLIAIIYPNIAPPHASQSHPRSRVDIKRSNPINTVFEDLTLGMTEADFNKKLIAHSISGKELYSSYLTYSHLYNIKLRSGGPEMKELDNIFGVYCNFYKGRMFEISIEYLNRYEPGPENFIYKTAQKYGSGTTSGDGVRWNDGKTTLTIQKESGDQLISYGEHYTVTYVDNNLNEELLKDQKGAAPSF